MLTNNSYYKYTDHLKIRPHKFQNFSDISFSSRSTKLELRTISGQNDPSQQPEDSPHSHHQAASDDNHCPSVGAATGVITVLVITINAVNAGLIMDSGGNALFFTIPDLLVTTILSLCLCFLNCDISNYGLRKFTEHFSVFATSE